MAADVCEAGRSVLFDPGESWVRWGLRLLLRILIGGKKTHHGRLSSASTGRLAVLRLPLLLSVLKTMSFAGGAPSTSISSS